MSRPSTNPIPIDQRLLVTVVDAAWILGVGEKAVRMMIRSGELPTVPVPGITTPRIATAALRQWVDRASGVEDVPANRPVLLRPKRQYTRRATK